MASWNATVLLFFLFGHIGGERRADGAHRSVSAAAGVLHAGEGRREKWASAVRSGLRLRSQKNAAAGCLLRYRNVYLRYVIYTDVQRGASSLTQRHVTAVNGQIGCCETLNL